MIWKKKRPLRRIRIVSFVENLICSCGTIMVYEGTLEGPPPTIYYICPVCGKEQVDHVKYPRFSYRPSLWALKSFILWKLKKIEIK